MNDADSGCLAFLCMLGYDYDQARALDEDERRQVLEALTDEERALWEAIRREEQP